MSVFTPPVLSCMSFDVSCWSSCIKELISAAISVSVFGACVLRRSFRVHFDVSSKSCCISSLREAFRCQFLELLWEGAPFGGAFRCQFLELLC